MTSAFARHETRYGFCCPNNPDYRAFVKGQIAEIAETFPTLDGLFFDQTNWPYVCHCNHCRDRFAKETGSKTLPDAFDMKNERSALFRKKRYEWLADFAKFVSDTAKALFPNATVSHNNAQAICRSWKCGVDERVIEEIVDEEVSIGDFVLTGGELPACLVVDAVARLVDGVLAAPECYENESISSGAVAGLSLKQAEVHGMSQRGGDVQSNLRLSTEEIHSDLIRQGTADLIISMEPMEALRYQDALAKDGWVVTSSHPYKNIPNYPDEEALMEELCSLPHTAILPIEDVARDAGLPKCANVVLLGMAARYIEILSAEQLRESIERVFASKGEKVVEMNCRAFDLGLNAVKE